MSAASPHVTIILLNWNGLERTRECLHSLLKIVYPNYDIVLLDNGSKDDEAAALRTDAPERAEILRIEKNRGFSGGVNYALKHVRESRSQLPDYFILLNNDIAVEPDFLSKMIETAEKHPKIGITGAAIHPKPPSKQKILTAGVIHWYSGRVPFLNELEDKERDCDMVHGCCFLFRSELLEKIGTLDENYYCYYEETDFCVRAKRAGYRIVVRTDAVIYHEDSATLGKVSGVQEFLMMRNRIVFVKKNGSGLQTVSTLLHATLIYGLRRAARAVLRGEFHRLKALARGLISGALNLRAT